MRQLFEIRDTVTGGAFRVWLRPDCDRRVTAQPEACGVFQWSPDPDRYEVEHVCDERAYLVEAEKAEARRRDRLHHVKGRVLAALGFVSSPEGRDAQLARHMEDRLGLPAHGSEKNYVDALVAEYHHPEPVQLDEAEEQPAG